MICFHRRHCLGDKHDLHQDDYRSWIEVKEHLIKEFKALIILPLYLYDHSGLTMRTYPFSCRWDSGQVGWIYITRERIKAEYSVKRMTKKFIERISGYLIEEVKTYDQWLTGDVYGYVIEDDNEIQQDSCWGFYGLEDCIAEAKSMVDWYQTKEAANGVETGG